MYKEVKERQGQTLLMQSTLMQPTCLSICPSSYPHVYPHVHPVTHTSIHKSIQLLQKLILYHSIIPTFPKEQVSAFLSLWWSKAETHLCA